MIFASSIWWSEMAMQIRAFTDSLLHMGIVLPGMTKASMLQIQRSLNRSPWRHGMLDPNDLKMGTQQGEWWWCHRSPTCTNYPYPGYPAKPPQMMIDQRHQLRAQDLAYKVTTKDQDALVEEHCWVALQYTRFVPHDYLGVIRVATGWNGQSIFLRYHTMK